MTVRRDRSHRAQCPRSSARSRGPSTAIDARIDKIYYGKFLAVRDSHVADRKEQDHRLHRPVGLRQVDGAALA